MKIDLYGKLKMNDNGEYIIDRINLTKVLTEDMQDEIQELIYS